jgi:hypothetical protein
MQKIIEKNTCLECNYSWWPRSRRRSPKCPNCWSAYWDQGNIKKGDYNDKKNTAKKS